MAVDLPLRKTLCETCPFKKGSKYACLEPTITESALTATRICHNTGTNIIGGETGIEEHLCRGSRQFQLRLMHALGVIDAPTDEAWNRERVNHGMKPTVTKDPE